MSIQPRADHQRTSTCWEPKTISHAVGQLCIYACVNIFGILWCLHDKVFQNRDACFQANVTKLRIAIYRTTVTKQRGTFSSDRLCNAGPCFAGCLAGKHCPACKKGPLHLTFVFQNMGMSKYKIITLEGSSFDTCTFFHFSLQIPPETNAGCRAGYQ